MEFSKKLTLTIVATWVLTIIGTILSKVFLDVDIEFILPYVNTIMVSDVCVYSLKSGVENFAKITK